MTGGQVSELQKRGRVVVSNPPPICVVPMVPAVQDSSWAGPSLQVSSCRCLSASPAFITSGDWSEAVPGRVESAHTANAVNPAERPLP
jgi:hypothetical protein